MRRSCSRQRNGGACRPHSRTAYATGASAASASNARFRRSPSPTARAGSGCIARGSSCLSLGSGCLLFLSPEIRPHPGANGRHVDLVEAEASLAQLEPVRRSELELPPVVAVIREIERGKPRIDGLEHRVLLQAVVVCLQASEVGEL